MGKKRARKTYISKGQRPNVAADVLKMVARGVDLFKREADLRKAWKKGRNPWITVKTSEKGTNKPYYKVRANSYWGNPKTSGWSIYRGKD